MNDLIDRFENVQCYQLCAGDMVVFDPLHQCFARLVIDSSEQFYLTILLPNGNTQTIYKDRTLFLRIK